MSKSDKAQRVEDLQRCLQSLHEWFAQNGLALNPDKTDVVSICPIWQHRTETAVDGINVAGINIKPADQLKSLGVILDHRLNFVPHVKNVCRNSFYHIRALRHIRRSINTECANEIACAIINTRLDYCNSLLVGTSQQNILALQRVQNAAAQECRIISRRISRLCTGFPSSIVSLSNCPQFRTKQFDFMNQPTLPNF